jgi:hypothetical protein
MAPRVNSELLLVGSLPADSAESALRYLSGFGVAMYCGFGRQPGADGTETMREHARVARTARSAASGR